MLFILQVMPAFSPAFMRPSSIALSFYVLGHKTPIQSFYATPFGLYFFAKNLPKIEKRWVKPGKNGEISGSDESL